MMKKIIIVGAGGLGREVLAWLLDILKSDSIYTFTGFLDANINALEPFNCSYSILGDPGDYIPRQDELFICALGSPKAKKKVCSLLRERGAQFFSLIHPSAVVGPRCSLGEGVVICPGAVLTTDITLGEFTLVNAQATIGHDAHIGPWSTISGHADVTGFAKLGEGVFLGSHASVLPRVQVGDYAIVGAGSVAVRRVKPNSTVFGVPAKQLTGFN